MSGSQSDEVAPQLFERFVDRAQAGLPEDFLLAARGIVVAGPDLIGGLDDISDFDESPSWIPSCEGVTFHRDLPDVNGGLLVYRIGEFWYPQVILVRENNRAEYWALVVAFENVPICARTSKDAIRLAEHCHPVTRAPMAGCWVKVHL
jgi:hypothetical protein